MTEENNIGRGLALALGELIQLGQQRNLGQKNDMTGGLYTDFSDDAVRARIETQISGQPRR